jgi:hypothetical protein
MNRSRKQKWLLALIALVAVAVISVAFSAAMMMRSDGFQIPPLPSPNGYDDLIKAAQLSVAGSPRTHEELQQSVAQNVEALRLARIGLGRNSAVPVDYANGDAFLARHHQQQARMKWLSRAMQSEARLFQAEGRINDAVRIYLEIVQLGQQLARGGLIGDRLQGIATEELGIKGLQALLPDLDAKVCRESARTLESLSAKREAMADTLAREDYFIRHSMGWNGKIARLAQFRTYKNVQQMWTQKDKALEVQLQKLTSNLVQRANELAPSGSGAVGQR